MVLEVEKKPNRSKAPLFLALDQGGHSTRAVVFDVTGELVARTRVKVSDSVPRPGWVEQDAEELTASLAKVLADTARLLGPDVSRLYAAGLATQRSNVVCWDRESGEALTSAISWQDRRAESWIRQFARWSDKVHEITGLYLSAHYGAGKLRWCLDHSAAAKQALQEGRLACGPLASFLAWRLLDSRPYLIDPANAARRAAGWDRPGQPRLVMRGSWPLTRGRGLHRRARTSTPGRPRIRGAPYGIGAQPFSTRRGRSPHGPSPRAKIQD